MSSVYLSSVGITAPGMTDWEGAVSILRGQTAYTAEPFKLPPPELLPATERRRSSDSVKLALSIAAQLLDAEAAQQLQPVAIFSSAYGDPTVTHKLCELLSETPPAASPTLFHNSVHNAPAGYWSIATNNPNATNSIAAGDYSAAAGLTAAIAHCLAEQTAVLLLCYDLPYPQPLQTVCPVSVPFASSLLLTPEKIGSSHLKLELQLQAGAEPSTMESSALEALRQDNPAARMLPLLQVIARGEGECRLAYSEQHLLQIGVTTCN